MKSDATLAAEIFRKIQAQAADASGEEVLVHAHPDVAHRLEGEEREGLERLRALIGRKISVQGMPSYHREEYDVTFR